MSWWTDFRDGLESIAAIAVNFFLPGSGAILSHLVSEGAQERLSGGPAQIAMLASGFAGAGAGNFSNYGAAMNAMSGGTAATGGVVGVGELGLEQQATLQQMLDQGYTQEQALAAVNQGGAGAATAGGAANAYNQSGAAETFQNQQMAGAAGTGAPYTGTGPFNAAGTQGAGSSIAGNLASPAAAGVAKSAGAMPWGSIGNVANLAQGAASIIQANRMPNYQAMADPFAQYRGEYGQRLAELERDPSSITKIPGYEAGLQAVRRSMNARGYGGSGNMMAALAKYGGDFYNQTANRYATLAGGGVSPVSGAQLAMQGDMNKYNLIRAGIGNLGYAGNMAGGGWPGA